MNIAKKTGINEKSGPGRYALWGLALAALVVPGTVLAQTAQDDATFDVTITLEESCELTTAPDDMEFGTVGLLNENHTADSTIYVTCTTGAEYTLSLDDGENATATRRMAGSDEEYVSYRLYSDSGYETLWGDGNTFGALVDGEGTGVQQTFTVYGRVEPGDNATTPPAGTYTDTVTIEVSF